MKDLSKYEKEKASPKPKATINSFRSFGYNLQTAVADIIDNSISAKAKNIWIDFEWKGQDSWISILDDGIGMGLKELISALTPGSKDPEEKRDKNDLGRFGLGLKTASFSQCLRVTVASKAFDKNLIKRCWDLDFVNQKQEWILLDYLSDEVFIEKLSKQKKGTLILWEKLDSIVGKSSENNYAIKELFYQEFADLEKHLSLTFHKYLENKQINIFFGERLIKSWNPFLLDLKSVSTIMLSPETIKGVEVTAFILPHISKIPNEQKDKSTGNKSWFEQQGFYVYRNNRLLVSGSWLGLFHKNDHSKLCRIYINFPNELDKEWKLDIKKSKAIPPLNLRKDLKRIGKAARLESHKVYSYRGKIVKRNPELPDFDFQHVWNNIKGRENVTYKLNRKHPFIESLLKKDSIPKSKLRQLISLVEENIPIETIIHYQNENPELHELRENKEEPTESVIQMAKELFETYKELGISKELALKQMFSIEPFNLFPVIQEYLK